MRLSRKALPPVSSGRLERVLLPVCAALVTDLRRDLVRRRVGEVGEQRAVGERVAAGGRDRARGVSASAQLGRRVDRADPRHARDRRRDHQHRDRPPVIPDEQLPAGKPHVDHRPSLVCAEHAGLPRERRSQSVNSWRSGRPGARNLPGAGRAGSRTSSSTCMASRIGQRVRPPVLACADAKALTAEPMLTCSWSRHRPRSTARGVGWPHVSGHTKRPDCLAPVPRSIDSRPATLQVAWTDGRVRDRRCAARAPTLSISIFLARGAPARGELRIAPGLRPAK